MGKSLGYISKLLLGMSLLNSILLALADNKLTAVEVVDTFNVLLAGLGAEFKLTPGAFNVFYKSDGSVMVEFSKELIDKLNLEL